MSKPLIAKIHIAKKQLGLDDDTYRQALATATSGKTSCANMNENELQAVLDAFKSKGFKPKKAKTPRRLSPPGGQAKVPEIDKVRAIWITMANHGFVRDSSEDALDAYTKRMSAKLNKGVGVDAVKWLNAYLASKVLEMLKQWHKRELLKWLVANGHERTNDIPVYKLTYEGLVWLFDNVNNEARAK